jgi:hypothetical protein
MNANGLSPNPQSIERGCIAHRAHFTTHRVSWWKAPDIRVADARACTGCPDEVIGLDLHPEAAKQVSNNAVERHAERTGHCNLFGTDPAITAAAPTPA